MNSSVGLITFHGKFGIRMNHVHVLECQLRENAAAFRSYHIVSVLMLLTVYAAYNIIFYCGTDYLFI
jgi:hypothetical protein